MIEAGGPSTSEFQECYPKSCARPTGGRYVRTTDDPAQQEQFLHACDLQLGRGEWPEPPEVYRKICEARDPAAVLERFKPEDPQRAFVNLAELYDTDVLSYTNDV
jgi:hypothetical protein